MTHKQHDILARINALAYAAHVEPSRLALTAVASDAEFYENYIRHYIHQMHVRAHQIVLNALDYIKNAAADTK